MRYEGVTFVDDACRNLSKAEFIEQCKDVFWQDRDEKTREKMLADVYERMKGEPVSAPTAKPAKKTKSKK